MTSNSKIFADLEKIASLIPAPLFWMDMNNVGLGCNDLVLSASGALKREELIGKTPHDYAPKDIADQVIRNIEQVIKEKKQITFEESTKDRSTGKIRYYLMTRSPLFDDNGLDPVGTILSAVEITDRKEKEHLQIEKALAQIESEVQNAKIQEHEKFSTIVSQTANNNLRQLSKLSAILNSCGNIPLSKLNDAMDITFELNNINNGLLRSYGKHEENIKEIERKKSLPNVLVSSILSDISNKYKANPLIEFNYSFEPGSDLAFIKINPPDFIRMMHNLINNAIEAFVIKTEKNKCKVDLKLGLNGNQVSIIIQDNGKGMPEWIVKKFNNNMAIKSDKEGRNGIGIAQAQATLQKCSGQMSVESKVDVGTKITLTFPKATPSK